MIVFVVGYDASRHNWFRHKDGPVPEKDVPKQNIVVMGNDTFLIQSLNTFLTCCCFTDLMLLELYKVSPGDVEPELVFEQLKKDDLVWEEEDPGSTFATKLLGIVTADEDSPYVAKLWRRFQEEQLQLEDEGFSIISGQNFYPKFIERLVMLWGL